ncbi:MAG TPA: hypothetical protein VFV23_06025 [Verrucomicrobiae bacterium]|nr:hypothetical protein [Verrucomicrobiae bacterium]
MCSKTKLLSSRLSLAAGVLIFIGSSVAAETNSIPVMAWNLSAGANNCFSDGTNDFVLALKTNLPPAFNQSAIKQSPEISGPNPKIPYFNVQFAMPVPPENLTNNFAALTGMDPNVFTHNHSPGFEVLPNGDCLAIYFSTPPGKAEADPSTSFVQARLRYGAEEWDMPELFYKTANYNDQSGLLWQEGNKLWFFGGGRDAVVPFKMATSTDNGATWTLSLPQLDETPTNITPQPITSAFRGPDGTIYFAMDGDGAKSFLWRSTDDGIHWHQMSGRTGGRHSVIVPVGEKGKLLSIGGKNASVNGWSPENVSTNWGESWSTSKESPFPPLGSAQRPSMIRLADGNLFFVSDAWLQKADRPPPKGWKNGDGCFVAISTNNGESWHIKTLPVQLLNHQFRKHGTLGYVTARQAPGGVIHVLTTETQPCLQYEMNEAWIWSNAGDIAPENSGGAVKDFSENYPTGKLRSKWSARICPHGRYLLNGTETDFYESGAKQHEVTYVNGRKSGTETFWLPDGTKLWTWESDLKKNTAVWTHFWSNGKKRVESHWNTKPKARDLDRSFFGFVANGPAYQWNEKGELTGAYNFTNGMFAGTLPMQKERGKK